MSQSIEKLATDLSAQVTALAEEKSTYTERMKKMEDAMEAYRAKCDQMEATMAEYNERMNALVKASEDSDEDEGVVVTDPNAPTPEPMTKDANELGGVNENKLLEKMPEHKQERKREGMPAAEAVAPTAVAEVISTDAKEEIKVETKAEEAVTAPVAEAPAPTPVAEVVAPKAEEVAPVTPAVATIDPELVAKIAEVASVKEALAQEVKVRDEALATVTKMKAEFESMLERIAKVEAQEMKAEKTIAKKVAELAVEPVASATGEQEVKTEADLVKEFHSLQSTDPKAARKFYLNNQEAIRKATWGNFKKA